MPRYFCKAKRGVSETVEETIEAESEEAALAKLAARGLYPIQIDVLAGAPQAAAPKRSGSRRMASRGKETLFFVQKLATLVRSKVELLQGIQIVTEQIEHADFRAALTDVYENVKDGRTFSDALAVHPEIFSPLSVSLIRAGEASGRLDESLDEIRRHLAREESLKRRVATAMAYPLLVLAVGIVSISVLMTVVVPRLAPVLETLGSELPLMTRVVLAVSFVFQKYWYWMVAAAAGAGLVFSRTKARLGKTVWFAAKTHLPLLKPLFEKIEVARLARTLALLLRGGVHALKAVEVASQSVEEPGLKKNLEEARQQIAAGRGLAASLGSCPQLPEFFVKMVAIGEQSGRLAEVLEELAESFSEEVDSGIAVATSLIEPALILGIGLVLGSVVLAILLPTFQITQTIR